MTVKAIKTEAEDLPIKCNYDGESYELPAAKFWPLEALEAQEENRVVGMLRSLLGEDQYKKFRSKPRVLQDIADFMDVVNAAAEVDRGK